MKSRVSLQFLKDLIHYNVLNEDKSSFLLMNALCLNKEFKQLINIISFVKEKKYNSIFIIVEDPCLHQIVVKKTNLLKEKTSVCIEVHNKMVNPDTFYSKKNFLVVNISNLIKVNKTTLEKFQLVVNIKKTCTYTNLGVYNISAEVTTLKSLLFLLTIIFSLLKK